MNQYVNGKLVPMTENEIIERNLSLSQSATYEKEFDDKINKRREKKISAIQKLKAIGLDEEELISLGLL
tara:strand:+ start:602 stop:808 length:207 start_codon:yes stop_codon:yes gene_type:complete